MLDNNSVDRNGLDCSFNLVITEEQIKKSGVSAARSFFKKNPQRGFRPGKIPQNFINRKSSEFRSMVLTNLISAEVGKVFAELGISPFVEPDVELTVNNVGEDVVCKVDSVVLPEIDEKDFADFELKVLKSSVPDWAVERSILRFLDNLSTWDKAEIPLDDNLGCVVNFLTDDREFKLRFRFISDDVNFISSSVETLFLNNKVKISKDEVSELTAKILDFVGKESGYKVNVGKIDLILDSVLNIVSPELTPDLLRNIGIDDGSEDSLRTGIKDLLEFQVGKLCDNYLAEQFVNFCKEQFKFDIPERLVEREMQSNGNDKPERSDIEDVIRLNMILSALMVHGAIELDKEKLESEVVFRMKDFGADAYRSGLRKLVEDDARYQVARSQAISYALGFMKSSELVVDYSELADFVESKTD